MTPDPATHTTTPRRLVTAGELMALGAGRRELVRGEVIEMTPAGGEHGRIAGELLRKIANHVAERNLGVVYTAETGFLLSTDPDTVRAPDIAFVRRARAASVRGYVEGSPDLAVEVVSPSDRYSDVEEKVHDFLRAGALQVWVVDPQTQIVKVFRPDQSVAEFANESVVDGGDLLPGFRLPAVDFFPPLPL